MALIAVVAAANEEQKDLTAEEAIYYRTYGYYPSTYYKSYETYKYLPTSTYETIKYLPSTTYKYLPPYGFDYTYGYDFPYYGASYVL